MFAGVLLVSCLYLSAVLSTPLYHTPIISEENEQPEASPIPKEIPLELSDAATGISQTFSPDAKPSKDLVGAETYYPVGGVWWGFRPGWGGWGGYKPWHGWHGWHGWGGHRPWHGWHGWHGWHRPWGGHWGGGSWGRTTS